MVKNKCQDGFFVDEVNGVKSVVEYHNDGDTQTVVTRPVLVDRSATGKERPWRDKKVNNIITSKVYRSLSRFQDDYWDKKACRLENCSTFLKFHVVEEPTQQLKLKSMNSCRVRLCPMCAWRRTLKVFSHARKIFTYLEESFPNKYSYLFLTLTVPNCHAEALADEITHLMQSFERLFRRKEVKSVVRGWYRGLEITHNHTIGSYSYDTYHPHFHVLLVVDNCYLKRNLTNGYISHGRWLKLWREACRDDSITQVDIQAVQPKRVNRNSDDVLSSNGIINAMCEVIKYTVKDSDYVIPYDWDLSQDIVKTLDAALANRRLIAWGGILKDIHKKLNLDDEVDGDLVNIDDDVNLPDSEMELLAFWHVGYQQYIIRSVEPGGASILGNP
jgi:plasmid rolling circle replication initiator protein Rep